MKILKFAWRIILNLAIVPVLFATVVAVVVGIFTQSDNQTKENYATSQENITRLKGDKAFAEVADPSFDAVSMAFLITLLVVFVFMVIYMIVLRNDNKPSESETPVS